MPVIQLHCDEVHLYNGNHNEVSHMLDICKLWWGATYLTELPILLNPLLPSSRISNFGQLEILQRSRELRDNEIQLW